MRRALAQCTARQVPGHSLAAFRFLFGATMLLATVRFFVNDWINELFVSPVFHFQYWGFPFVRPWPAPLMFLHFVGLGLAALCVALGLFYRVAIISFFFLFAYVELLDVTTYLNHYYAVLVFAALLCFLPAARVLSLDRWLHGRRLTARPQPTTVPFVAVFLLRAQLGIIYFFAGVAKLNHDWLLEARPLGLWLQALSERPWLSSLQSFSATPHVMSWAGAFFDLTIPFWLSYRTTRPWGYLAVVAFHLMTALLFPIGIFPWLMIGLTPIFFEPTWPLVWLRASVPLEVASARPLSSWAWKAAIGWLTVQCLIPLRHHLYAGDVLDTEQGFRWSWQVMIVERRGLVTYRVVYADGHIERVSPHNELTPLQARIMATQPDLILAYAHHLRMLRGQEVQVFVDAFVSTNGHKHRRLIDPAVDLSREQDTLFGYDWLLTDAAKKK